MQCTVSKKSARRGAPATKAKKGDPVAGFQLQDNEDDTFTIFGTSAANPQVDISAIATIAVTSDNTAVLTVDSPSGMTDKVHGLTAGTANVTIVATWGDSSVGPFTITVPVTVVKNPNAVTGISINWGTPTVR